MLVNLWNFFFSFEGPTIHFSETLQKLKIAYALNTTFYFLLNKLEIIFLEYNNSLRV